MSDETTPEPNLLHSLYQRSLDALTRDEWESLCDGCGRCCLHRLHDLDDIIWETRVACTLLDTNTCQCSDYPNRHEQVPGCLRLTPHLARTLDWLPDTCAYRLVAHGQPLHDWHHLVSGDRDTVHTAGVSVRGQIISEDEVDPDDYHLWIWDDEPA